MQGILHVNKFAEIKGGAEVYIKSIAENFKKFSHYLIYLNKGDSDYLRLFNDSRQVTLLDLKTWDDLISRWNIKYIVFHDFTYPCEESVFLKRGARFICLIHDYRPFYLGTGYNRLTFKREIRPLSKVFFPFTFTRETLRNWVLESKFEKLEKLDNLKKFDQIHVFAEDMKQTAIKNCLLEKIFFVNPCGISNIALLPRDKIIGQIAFAGNLIRGKGLFLLLKALKGIKFHYHLKIAGDGYQRIQLEKYVLRNKINVTFLGKLTSHEVRALYGESQFSVAPSILEPFGLTIIESMSQETPVIAFREGGPKEIIQDRFTGLLCEPHKVCDLREKIIYLLSRPGICEEMGKKARLVVLEKYTIDKHITRFSEIIEKK